jgi:hypothetical protein
LETAEFKAFPESPQKTRRLKFVEFTSDGLPDILISEHQATLWYQAPGEACFGYGSKTHRSFDEENGPRLVFADTEQTIHFAWTTLQRLTRPIILAMVPPASKVVASVKHSLVTTLVQNLTSMFNHQAKNVSQSSS